jgi:Rieske Fe-S protein
MQQPDPVTPVPQAPPPRRTFLRLVTAALGSVAAAIAGVPIIGYFVSQRHRQVHWVTMGAVDDFPLLETRRIDFDNPLSLPWDGQTAATGVYVRNLGPPGGGREPRFMVLAVNCAHLGCPVSWFPQSGLFMCPCHGGVYYADGARASGPPPRGMFACAWRVRDGRLEIQAPHFPTLQNTLTETA